MGSRVTLIGSLPRPMETALRDMGFALSRSASASASKQLQSDIIIISQSKAAGLADLLRSARQTPKIVILNDAKPSSAKKWLREPFCHVLINPGPLELATYATRLMKEAAGIHRAIEAERQMALLKDELSFFENMNRSVSSKTTVDEILRSTAKWAKKALGSDAWAVLVMDQQTGKLTPAHTSLNLKKSSCVSDDPGSLARTVISRNKPCLITGGAGRGAMKKCTCNPCSIISVPVSGKNGAYGAIEIINIKPKSAPFTQRDMELLGKLAGHVAIAIEKIKLQQKLEDLVVTDDLTNLFNTRYLHHSIEGEINRCDRYGNSVSLIFMDIDHFKDINDNFGHLVGSKLLVEVGQILIRELRNIDIVSRYGGDEFVLVLPQTSLSNAINIAERLRKAIAKAPMLTSEGLSLSLTASFGVAAYPDSAKSKEELLRLADESMYRVKNRTRNGVYAII